MALTKYKQKRSFTGTPEPKGGKVSGKELRFVVQKHAASRLHYDLRLEMQGVLKSWAVPKGPSLNPEDKRLAMEVEDHPYDYRNFEGIIPKGNYGAGTVIVWDEGTYEPIKSFKSKKAQEKELLIQLKAGSLKFILHGQKLKGEFALVKTKGMAENAWLLIKHKDQFAKKTDVTKLVKSVVSGKTLERVAKAKPATKSQVKKQVAKQVNAQDSNVPEPALDVAAILRKAPKGKFPTALSPMLATLVDAPFDDPGWEYEIKWDGYRALAFMKKGKVQLKSRNNKSFEDKFYPVFEDLKAWELDVVIDGEIVAVNGDGISNFNRLQNWRSEADGALLYYVFDVLWLDGKNLMGLPLNERKAVLQTLIPNDGLIRSGYSIEARGTEFFDVATKMGLEGIIAKRSDSHYHPGDRSRDWLKIKVQKRQEVVIGGFTRNEGTSKQFSSLLLGVYEQGKLKYAGKVGTGFNDKIQGEMMRLFKPLIITKSPFDTIPDYNKPSRFRSNPPPVAATWLKPELVCEVHFAEITQDGVFRHPSFIAMREDKKAKQVIRETAAPADEAVAKAGGKTVAVKTKATDKNAKDIMKAPVKGGRKTLLNPADKTQVRKVNGHELKFTNLDKIFWPDEAYTKGDLINYYYQIAPYILPYLKNRPQSLNRFPNGIKGKSFYQKDITGKVPDWIDKFPYKSEGQRKNYMLGNNEASLLFMANAGAIEMHPWSSTVKKPDNPDWCVLDLDPDKDNTFEQVIEVAQTIKAILDDIKVPGYCKTSGSTGLHIYIPLGAKYSYDQSQLFTHWIAAQANEVLDFTSIERMTRKRKGLIYIDYLQNRPSATLAAPYSVRPKPGATVSMPLHWQEVKKGLQIRNFTIANAIERVRSEGDLFKPVIGKGIDLKKILKAIA